MRVVLRVEAMDCSEEATLLRSEIARLPGIQEISFDLLRGRMAVTYDPAAADRAGILAAVRRTGMNAMPWADQEVVKRSRTLATSLAGLATAAGVVLQLADTPAIPAFLAGALAGTWYVFPRAWTAVRRLRPDMNLLMCVAILGAAVIGEWFEASTVAFLFSLSLSLEAWSVRRARRAIEALLELAPATAHVLQDGGESEVPAEQVEPGSRIVIKPGERVPLDGAVEAGTSQLDESLLTGESLPVGKDPGDPVFAGSINGDGVLHVRTTRAVDESTVAHIARLVEAAGERRSRSERWVDRFAQLYTPIVMGLALLVLILPPLLWATGWSDSLYRALVLLVIACPCALVISTPVAIVSGLAAAARHGVLVKEGGHLESPARLRAVAFDKTGTLTKGRPRVVEIVALAGHSENELLARAAALETGSEHPLAGAILAASEDQGVSVTSARGVRAVRGKGVEGTLAGRPYWVGSHRWLAERGNETPEIHGRLESLSGPGRSVLIVGNDRHVCGLIAVADEIRPEAAATIRALRQLGVEHVVMLTGDNEATARAIGEGIGVDEIRAELLPEDKIAAIEEIHARVSPVAMVGDGINDAPALARADLGIAMAAAGSDTAIETADIALMTSDLRKLPWLIRHSRRTLAIIRQNIAVALAVKAIVVLMTFGGAASLWAAITADMGASLAVVFNALRLLSGSDARPAPSDDMEPRG